MLERVVSYLQFGNHFCGIEHTIVNGKDTIITCLLKKGKNKIEIERSYETNSIEEATKSLPKNQHAVLIINNDHVLSKSITSEIKDPLKLVYKVFPNIDLNQFYYEVLSQGKTNFISICRKDQIDTIIKAYSKQQIKILNFSLGNTCISGISEFISNTTILTSNATIVSEQQLISSIDKSINETISNYDVNGLEVTNKMVLSLAGALHPILKTNTSQTNFKDLKQTLDKDYKQSRFFNQFFKFSLLFILGLLLLNFLFFNHYFDRVKTLQQTSQVNETNKATILKLNDEVNTTKKLVDDMLKSNTSKSSYYTNDIVKSLPNTLLLTELHFQPLLKRVKEDQPVNYNEGIIIVSGESTSSEVFSEWIATLETKKWIDTIKIKTYSDTSKSKSIFTIILNLNHD